MEILCGIILSSCCLLQTLVASEALGPPRNLRVVFIRADPPFATVTWDPPAYVPGPIDYYWMRFGEKDQTRLEERQITGRTPFTAIMGENGLIYEISVAADIDGERGEYALEVVKAPELRPIATPEYLNVTGLSPTSMRVSWNPPMKSGRRGKIVNYMVEWRKYPGESQWTSNVNTSDTAVTVGDTTPLEPDTDYVIRVRAFTSAGYGPISPTWVFRTDKAVVLLGPPRNIEVTFVYYDPPFGTVTWDPPAETPGPIDFYWMKFGERNSTINLEEKQLSGRTPFTAIYAENGLEYQIEVVADIDGERGEYAFLTVKAPDGRPSAPPQNFSVTGLSPSSVRVNWDPPERASRKGKIVNYTVEWRKETESHWTHNMNSSITAVTVGDSFPLDADTDYLFRVRAFTSAGAGPETELLQFRTDKQIPIGPYGDVPPALLNCTLTRTDDARMMAPDWEAHPEVNTEEECAAKCLEVPMCDSATFTNTSKTCEIHPRRVYFRVGWMGKEGTSVMFEKDCPSFVKYPGRVRNRPTVICPLDRGVPKPSKKYAYKMKRYRTTYEDGAYECRKDELCAGLSYEIDPLNGKLHFTYYYDAIPDEGTPISNRSAVKNCQPTGPNCGFFEAYYKKSIRQNWPFLYSTVALRQGYRRAKLSDCLALCENASRCHAASMVDYFRQLDCKLYDRPPRSAGRDGYRNQLKDYTGFAEVTTWTKTPSLCTQGTGK